MKLVLQSLLSLAKMFFAIHSPAHVSSHMVEKCPTIFTIPTGSYLRPKKVLSMGQEDANSATYGPGRGPSLVMSDFIQNVTVGLKNKCGYGIHLEKLM
ncbi:hypothetical protein GH714_012983 [Hevea brasiliensis]|uniref:Uncharacterized protein n=1 Tax=Hevea brasiliensis TaxID=3981 RepID=A0A6A6ND46_HEVBR|nr:hypothetical protein GH714_012983 [Hevea brasiliensis]